MLPADRECCEQLDCCTQSVRCKVNAVLTVNVADNWPPDESCKAHVAWGCCIHVGCSYQPGAATNVGSKACDAVILARDALTTMLFNATSMGCIHHQSLEPFKLSVYFTAAPGVLVGKPPKRRPFGGRPFGGAVLQMVLDLSLWVVSKCATVIHSGLPEQCCRRCLTYPGKRASVKHSGLPNGAVEGA